MKCLRKEKLLKLLETEKQNIVDCEKCGYSSRKNSKDINKIEQINEKEKTFVEQVADVMSKIEENTLKGTDYSLYTGITDLDNIMCGLHRQELTIIGGKTWCRKDNTCTADSRVHSKQRNRDSFCEFRNV